VPDSKPAGNPSRAHSPWGSILPPEDPAHPVRNALRDGFLRRWDGFGELLRQLTQLNPMNQGHARRAEELMAAVARVAADLKELLEWLLVKRQPISTDEAFQLTSTYPELQDPAWRTTMIHRLTHGARGRPATKRQLAIQVLEERLLKRTSWTKLTRRRYCPCGEQVHNAACAERLRSEVRVLQKFLSKHGITVPN